MESVLLSSILFGILGGSVRAIVGIAKYFEKNKEQSRAEKKRGVWGGNFRSARAVWDFVPEKNSQILTSSELQISAYVRRNIT